jgi:hypothetical protein
MASVQAPGLRFSLPLLIGCNFVFFRFSSRKLASPAYCVAVVIVAPVLGVLAGLCALRDHSGMPSDVA